MRIGEGISAYNSKAASEEYKEILFPMRKQSAIKKRNGEQPELIYVAVQTTPVELHNKLLSSYTLFV